jgi:hypothetical protein
MGKKNVEGLKVESLKVREKRQSFALRSALFLFFRLLDF